MRRCATKARRLAAGGPWFFPLGINILEPLRRFRWTTQGFRPPH
jgi:hypothetical protein